MKELNEATLEIKAKRNEYENEQSTLLRVQSKTNSGAYEVITLKQAYHTITYTPSGFKLVSALGGESEEIKVKASAPFTIKLTSQDLDARLNDVNGPTEISYTPDIEEDEEYSFKVVFPRLTDYYVDPTVTVQLLIDGTQISKSFAIKQSLPALQSIIFQSTSTTYGTLYHNTGYRKNYVQQLYESINNQDLFGSEGVVPVKDMQIKYKLNNTLSESTILVANLGSSQTEANRYVQWLKEDTNKKRVLMVLQDLYSVNFMNRLASAGLAGYTNTGYSGPGTDNAVAVKNYGRTVNGKSKGGTELTPDNNKLYEYLFKTGPFTTDGEINPSDVFLFPYDNINHALILANCPETMIPLIMDRDQQYILLGVDPTNRFIFCGEMELFGNKYNKTYDASEERGEVVYNGTHNYENSPQADTNLKFLHNLIAWMINVNLYGEEFTSQFID